MGQLKWWQTALVGIGLAILGGIGAVSLNWITGVNASKVDNTVNRIAIQSQLDLLLKNQITMCKRINADSIKLVDHIEDDIQFQTKQCKINDSKSNTDRLQTISIKEMGKANQKLDLIIQMLEDSETSQNVNR